MTQPLQVAFITGQSDPAGCALSPEQEAFLDQLPVPLNCRVRRNFPYALDTAPHRPAGIIPAGWHNARQFLASRRRRFVDEHRPAVLDLLARADRTALLAGSCGLELLANLSLPADALRRTHVFAYGPVARRRPACDVVAVCGRHDWIARAWGGSFDHVVDAHHMSYLTNAKVLALCQAWVSRLTIAGGAG